MKATTRKYMASGLSVLLGMGLLLGGAGCGGSIDTSATTLAFPSSPQKVRAHWDERIEGPEQNFRFRDRQWHLRNISAFTAWTITQGNPEVTVAVIDSGVDYNHPALQGRVIKGPNVGDNTADPMDSDTHGTHVAGIIGADGDVKGIAPKVKIMAIKVFPSKDNPNYDFSDGLAKAIIYAAERGASVINMSIGSNTLYRCSRSEQVDSAINEAFNRGVSLVTSAGNSAFDHVQSQCSTLKKNVNTIPVVATDENDRLADFSNYGNLDHPRIVAAPGVRIYSTVPTNSQCGADGCYDYKDGTSMAAPAVAGALALIRSAMYDDYVRIMTKKSKTPLSLRDFFFGKQKQAMSEMRLSISPARLAERLLFHFTNLNNYESNRNPANVEYDATRDPVLGFGRIDVGAAVTGASKVFSAYLSE